MSTDHVDLAREIRAALEDLKYRATGPRFGPADNGYVYAEIPDWRLRQWLDAADAPASGEPSGAALRAVIERDRTQVARCIDGLDRVLRGCSWLAEGRGPYEWDDDKYQAEFGRALDALRQGIEPLRAIARDWSDSPTTQAEVDAARASMEPSEAVVRETCGCPLTERQLSDMQVAMEEYREITDRLQQCVQRHRLGLGGERIDVLVCDEVDRLRAAHQERDADALSAVHRTLAFFRSVIQSGESWSETCQREYDMAMGVLDAAMGAAAARTVQPATAAWQRIPDAQALKACPGCGGTAIEGEVQCARCGAEPTDDETWRQTGASNV